MNWYYVDEGRQAGPVDEEQFKALIQVGKITAQTLVWKDGMPQWQPCGDIMPTPQPGTAPIPTPAPTELSSPNTPAGTPDSPSTLSPDGSMVACSECGRTFPREETIQYASQQICAECKPVFLQRIQQGDLPGAATYEFAGFWIRFVAKVIDGIILMLVVGIPLGILFVMGGDGFLDSSGNSPEALALVTQLFLQVGAMLFSVLYNTWFIGRYGATPGKMVVGLRVITGDGQPVSYLRAFGRGWAEQLSGMICYIGYIIVVFDDQKRALHDHICNTRVIKK